MFILEQEMCKIFLRLNFLNTSFSPVYNLAMKILSVCNAIAKPSKKALNDNLLLSPVSDNFLKFRNIF